MQRNLVLLLLLLSPFGMTGRTTGAPTRESPLRVRFLFWHESPADERAREGVLEGLRIARIPVDIAAFNAGYDVAVITDEAARRREQERAQAAVRDRLESWRREGDIDLLVAMGTRAALLAKETYTEIPIVFTAVTHPAASGVTESFGPTGRNLTGNSNWVGMDRVLKLFRRAMPSGGRLGVVTSPTNAVSRAEIEEAWRHVASATDLRLVVRTAATPDELGDAVRTMAPDIDALWIPIDDLCYRNVDRIRAALGDRKIPLVSSSFHAVRQGAVVGISADYELLGLGAADLIRRIAVLGEDPGTIPIGRIHTFDVDVNLRAAAEQGITLAPELVASADRIITALGER